MYHKTFHKLLMNHDIDYLNCCVEMKNIFVKFRYMKPYRFLLRGEISPGDSFDMEHVAFRFEGKRINSVFKIFDREYSSALLKIPELELVFLEKKSKTSRYEELEVMTRAFYEFCKERNAIKTKISGTTP